MVLLEADRFLSELTRLFESTKEKGSISITQKRGAFLRFVAAVTKRAVTESEKKMTDDNAPRHRCLIRARTEKKKISTVVRPSASRRVTFLRRSRPRTSSSSTPASPTS